MLPRWISLSETFPMCLNPVRVSVKVRPSALASVSKNLEETVEAKRCSLDEFDVELASRWLETSQWPRRAPSSLPLKTLQPPLVFFLYSNFSFLHSSPSIFWAQASRSASGSLARM